MRREGLPGFGLPGFVDAVADILKEVSPILRVTIVLGLVAGLAVIVRIVFATPVEAGVDISLTVGTRLIFFAWLAIVVAGGFLGLVVGVVIELIWEKLRGPKSDKRAPRRKC